MKNCTVYGWPRKKKSDIPALHSGYWNFAKACSTWIWIFKTWEFLSALTKPSDTMTFPAATLWEGCMYLTGGYLPNYYSSIPLRFLLKQFVYMHVGLLSIKVHWEQFYLINLKEIKLMTWQQQCLSKQVMQIQSSHSML